MQPKHIAIFAAILVLSNLLTAMVISKNAPEVSEAPAGGLMSNESGAVNQNASASPEIQALSARLIANSQDWASLTAEQKEGVLQEYMKIFRERENSVILNSPSFYVSRVDDALNNNPTMKSLSLPVILKISAVMEYDFYNGQDKEKLAQEILGPQIYEMVKARKAAQQAAMAQAL